MYLLKFLEHPSFKKNKFKTILNGIVLFILIIFNKNKIISIFNDNKKFFFKFMPLKKGDGSRGLFIYRENYEPLLQNYHNLLKKNDVVLDIGANQGIYSLAFAKLIGENGKVIAIEPFKQMNNYFKDNIRLNGFQNIEIIEKVVSDNIGYEEIDFGSGIVSASIVRNFKNSVKQKVESTTVDEICKNLDRLDFIKIDIEGAELKALKGAEKTLNNHKPKLSLEVDQHSFEHINSFLEKYGYKPYIFEGQNLIHITNITKEYPTMIFKTN
mgnify:FL=1|tara:strand:+ start:2210 stop:3016 length:807 start_codon:yes stop_codon:yes gene_type:complete